MKTKLMFAAVALMMTMPAIADFKLITQGDEVVFGMVRLPQSGGEAITYKPCDECDYVTRRLASGVRWQVNGQSLTLPQFLERTAHLSNRDAHSVTVTRHIESNQITLVSTIIRDSR
ncbi:MAG: hypothetical protein HQ492_05425 [Woeseiaceae bacterium]|nr:hypothetical protein [Woeseiaceae bacterium]